MKVLLLDTGFSALPIYSHLVAEGHDVWVIGNRPQDAIAHHAGDHWIEQDYSQVAKVAREVERHGIDCLVPGCTDMSIATCVAIAGGNGRLDCADANRTLSDKSAFRALCADLDLPAPRAVSADQLPLAGRFICKPVDAFSGRGITVFAGNDREAGSAAFAHARAASPTGTIIVEPFVEGQLYSWSSFIENGRVIEDFFVREGSSANPFAVDTSHVEFDMPEAARQPLAAAIERIVDALRLVDGLIHTQFIWSGEEVFIVEITRRCPGDLYALLVEYSTGYEYAAKFASQFTGTSFSTARSERRFILRHTVTSPKEGIYCGLAFDYRLPLHSWFSLSIIGQTLTPGHAGRIGIYFAESTHQADRDKAYESFIAREIYRIL